MKTITIVLASLALSFSAFSQVFTYNGSYSIGVNTGTAIYQYSKIEGQEVKNGTFSFVDKVDNYTVNGIYSKGEQIGDWTEVRKFFTYNDFPINKSDLIMSRVPNNNPYKETTVTIKSKFNTDKSHTEVQTKNVLLQWGYPSVGTSNWSVTVTRRYDAKGYLVAVEGSYTNNTVKKSSFKGALKNGYGVGNWEIMDRPGYTDIFKFENYRIVGRTRIDNLTKKIIEKDSIDNNTGIAASGIGYKRQYKILVDANEGTLYVKEISPGVYTYKTVENIESSADFLTIDMSFMSSLFNEMLPTGFPKELKLKETVGFPKFAFEFNSFCEQMEFYSIYTNNYSNWDKLSNMEKTLFSIQNQLSIADGADEKAFPKNLVNKLYYSESVDYATVMETMSLLAMAKDWESKKKVDSAFPGKLDNILRTYDLYNDSLSYIIMKRYFQPYTKDELWKDVLFETSEELKNCDTVLYTFQFDYLKRIFSQIDGVIAKYNQGICDEVLKKTPIKIGDLEFLATDLNVIPKEKNASIIYEKDYDYPQFNRVRKAPLSSLITGTTKGQMLYNPSLLKTDPCPKGYKIPTVEDFKKMQLTLDYNMGLIENGGALNFNSDFRCLWLDDFDTYTVDKNFLVYNDMKDPKLNGYKFLYFQIDGYRRKEAKAKIDAVTFVKCRCIKE